MSTVRKFTFDLDFDAPEEPETPEPEVEEEEEEEIIPTFSEEEVEQARAEGFDAGKEEGRREAADATEQKLLETVETACAKLADVYNTQTEANREIGREMISVATAIAKKMFPDLNARNALGEVERVVQETLKAVTEEPRIQIMVNPELREPLSERLSTMTHRAGFEGKVFVNPDPAMQLGDCRIEWSNGAAVRDSEEMWQMIDKIIEENLHDIPDDETEDDGVVGSVTASPKTPSRGLALPGAGGSPRSAMRSIMRAASSADDKQLRVLDMAVRMREVLSSERANDIAEKRLTLSARALEAQRLNLDAAHEANELHSEANTIAKSSLQRKDVAARKAEAEKALGETRAALADAFYAGLVVVLCTTLAGGWRRAMAALDSVIGVCPRPAGGTGFSGAAWAIVGGGPGPLDYAWCVTRAFVRAAWGGLLLLFVGWKLLQYNVVTNYQSAPAFVLLVVLGGGCGQLGRSAVDSLGGDGDLWLRMWGGYMCAAAACTWRADFVTLVCGKIGPVGRLVFYAAFGALAPFCVGAAPFEDTFGAFAESLADRAMFLGETAARAVEDAGEIIGFGFLWGPAGR